VQTRRQLFAALTVVLLAVAVGLIAGMCDRGSPPAL
jgi:hypothetical protein